MHEVTRILSAIGQGDPQAAEQLLPLVYDELRRLAAEKMAQEKPGQTLQATALVHEAYLRLVDGEKAQHWDSRGHFFVAAAEAMRRILVENARRKQRPEAWRRPAERVDLDNGRLRWPSRRDRRCAGAGRGADQAAPSRTRSSAELVKLRYYGGLSLEQAAELLWRCRSGRRIGVGHTRGPGFTRHSAKTDPLSGFEHATRLRKSCPGGENFWRNPLQKLACINRDPFHLESAGEICR